MITNELQNATINPPLTLNFKSAKLSAYARQIATIGSEMRSKNVEIAKILGRIKTEKAYEEDGFKSVQEFAEKTFGIAKASAYQLAAVGERFYNAESNETKAIAERFTPANLAELKGLTDEQINKAIEDGTISSASTQKQLREAAKTINPTAKPVILEKTYDGWYILVHEGKVISDSFENRVLEAVYDDIRKLTDNPDFKFKAYEPGCMVAASPQSMANVQYAKHETSKQKHDKAAKNGKAQTFTAEQVRDMMAELITKAQSGDNIRPGAMIDEIFAESNK